MGGLEERLELAAAMGRAKQRVGSVPKQGDCDFVPALELVGIYAAHAVVTRRVFRGELSAAAGAYLAGALGCHAFSILHHCTHGSISQHVGEHEGLEATVFRLGCLLIFFDDGYKEAHKAHHNRANEPEDPDIILSHSSLPELGDALHSISTGYHYVTIGYPISLPMLRLLHFCGLLKSVAMSWPVQRFVVNWDNVMLKMAAFTTLKLMDKYEDYHELGKALQATWRGGTAVTYFILALFFARFPHRNGFAAEKEEDSFFDTTYRGESEVDLWMMGEGAHHMHHAKSDISYAHLSQICTQVETSRPDLKTAARGTGDLIKLETESKLPPRVSRSAAPPRTWAAQRTSAVLEAKHKLLHGKIPEGVAQIAGAAMRNAIRCCTKADRGLLVELHRRMKLSKVKKQEEEEEEEDHQIPTATWHKTVFSDAASKEIKNATDALIADVCDVAAECGRHLPAFESENDIKRHYISFFTSLCDVFVGTEQQLLFLHRLARRLQGKMPHGKFPKRTSTFSESDRAAMYDRLRVFLESPIPDNILRSRAARSIFSHGSGTSRGTRTRLASILSPHRSKL